MFFIFFIKFGIFHSKDIVMNHYLQETSFTKEVYTKYIKDYMKLIVASLERCICLCQLFFSKNRKCIKNAKYDLCICLSQKLLNVIIHNAQELVTFCIFPLLPSLKLRKLSWPTEIYQSLQEVVLWSLSHWLNQHQINRRREGP